MVQLVPSNLGGYPEQQAAELISAVGEQGRRLRLRIASLRQAMERTLAQLRSTTLISDSAAADRLLECAGERTAAFAD